jgi:hypothetical protein
MTRCALGIDASVERSECGLAFKRRSRRRKDALFCDLRRAFSRQRRGLVLLGRKPPTVTPQYGQPGGLAWP